MKELFKVKINNIMYTVHHATQEELKEMMGDTKKDTRYYGVHSAFEQKIAILRGLPYEVAKASLVHEVGHAIFATNGNILIPTPKDTGAYEEAICDFIGSNYYIFAEVVIKYNMYRASKEGESE